MDESLDIALQRVTLVGCVLGVWLVGMVGNPRLEKISHGLLAQ